MVVLVIFGLVALGAVLWVLLDRHEKRRAAAGLPRHSGLRLVLAAAALLILLFSGGCGILLLANQDSQYITWQVVAAVAGPPFAISALVLWLTLTRVMSPVAGIIGLAALLALSFFGLRFMHEVLAGPDTFLAQLAIAILITGVTGVVWWSGRSGGPA